ncbi:BCCT family transporter [Limimaricola pyoseonensis]|uniref:Betaine/carnitine transporter, BCCT family n=1 Tax=Limimaricola pyoseonensis TaxID=521013 RepID=A0A1G7GU12_9RHOB|nr:BCCT family transporter [Limimaricola pyoseonensis]SDE91533.1 betaine/carnitine transporter, BCCT family [Limimaricola pyoseonensis]
MTTPDTDPDAADATRLIDETDYEVGQDNIQTQIGPFGLDIHNPVFLIAGLGIVAFVIGTLMVPDQATALFESVRDWLTANFSWFFILGGNIFVLFGLLLIVTPLGSVRLGGESATPDFGYAGWFAMLFAAGMGIGLMFYGVSEPLSHFSTSVAEQAGTPESWAPLAGAPGDPEQARMLGMAATIYHWGLHPWAMYAVVALALALFSYNQGLPLSIRSAFYPLLGERVWGWSGHVIDVLAVFATLFGLATSLGFGAEQAVAGMDYLFGVGDTAEQTRQVFGFSYNNPLLDPEGNEVGRTGAGIKIVLILAITAIALVSVMAGLDGGVKRASEINMFLAFMLLLFVLFVGPTGTIISTFFGSLWAYIVNFPALSQPFGREDANFSQGWTAFYWAWWISWSPFVGMFIARVSRGRTVREFMIAVLLVPSLVCVLWMSVFGGTAITQVVQDGFRGAAEAALPVQLFEMLSQLPLATITSLIGIVLVIVFFVTSSDSGSLVIDTITAGGKTDGPLPQRVFWCIFEGLVAIALLLGGGLAALQAMAVATGFPFAMVLLVMCVAIFMALRNERKNPVP